MEIIKYPEKITWGAIAKRPTMDVSILFDTVDTVLQEVKREGDAAVKIYEEKYDKVRLEGLQVSGDEITLAAENVSDDLKQAIRTAHANIFTFHAQQKFVGKKIETTPGVTCWQKAVAIEKVGLYIPGGTAPLFSTVLMLAVPARLPDVKKLFFVHHRIGTVGFIPPFYSRLRRQVCIRFLKSVGYRRLPRWRMVQNRSPK